MNADRNCRCCHGRGVVVDIEGVERPCSRCRCDDFSTWADARRPNPPLPYIFRWNRQGRKGQPCEVLARGKMNSCEVRFADGYTMITSRNALMRNKKTSQ